MTALIFSVGFAMNASSEVLTRLEKSKKGFCRRNSSTFLISSFLNRTVRVTESLMCYLVLLELAHVACCVAENEGLMRGVEMLKKDALDQNMVPKQF